MLTCAGTIGRCFQYDGSPSYFQDSNIVWIDNPKEKITNDFLFYALQRHDWRELNTTTITRLYNDDIRNIDIVYPQKKKEQEKICRLILLIDRRIEVQRKTIEELESLKDVLAHKNSSEDGQLGNICHAFSSSLKESETSVEGKYPVYGANGLVGFSNSYQFSNPGVAIIKDGAGVGKCFLISDLRYSVLGTMTLLLPKEGDSLIYLYYALRRVNYSQYTVGSGIPHIYFKDYSLARIPKETSYTINLATCYSRICQQQKIVEKERIEINKLKAYLLASLFI